MKAPRSVSILPLTQNVLLPYHSITIQEGRPFAIDAIEAALLTPEKRVVACTQRLLTKEIPSLRDIVRVGSLGVIRRMVRLHDRLETTLYGLERIRLVAGAHRQRLGSARVSSYPYPRGHRLVWRQSLIELKDLAERLFSLWGKERTPRQIFSETQDPLSQTFRLVALLDLDVESRRNLLEAHNLSDAITIAIGYFKSAIHVLTLEREISSKARASLGEGQRRRLLRAQLQQIQTELGDENPQLGELTPLRRALNEIDLPASASDIIGKELHRLSYLRVGTAEYQLSRSYLEFVSELPWARFTEDQLDSKLAKLVLEERLYDLEEVKDRILEQLALLRLNPEAPIPALCFVGPPGVGKASLAETIAHTLRRKFVRLSIAGLNNETDLRGFRRGTPGATPGRILSCIHQASVANPVLLLDEIDKLGGEWRGDPSGALVELLDPLQQHTFFDHYLNLPFDLSKVFFIATANSVDTIPQAIFDRLEIVRLSGYTDTQKIEIAYRYLLPRLLRSARLSTSQVRLPINSLRKIIELYTREGGVQQLEAALARLVRKSARRIADGESAHIEVPRDSLREWLGAEHFFFERAREHLPPGVATGLAWTDSGGEVLYIEATLLQKGKGVTLTGHLGKVMRESAEAAISFIWSRKASLHIPVEKFEFGIHIHVPAGAVPKDGPSAGITMATALVSLFADLPARHDVAMTGEITLTGLLLPIGGVKEKTLAAHRASIRSVILPKENEKDLHALPKEVRESMRFILVGTIDEVFDVAIPNLKERTRKPKPVIETDPPLQPIPLSH